MEKLLRKEKINDVLALLSKDSAVLVPSETEGASRFVIWEQGTVPAFGLVNTELPPKDVLFPQTEKMYHYKTGKNLEIKEISEAVKTVIFGIRSCDMKSIDCMDMTFLGNNYEDSYYKRKRDNLTTVAIGCIKAAPECFCESMGIDPSDSQNADIQLDDFGDAFRLRTKTEKGELLAGKIASHLEELPERYKVAEKQEPICTIRFDLPGDLPERLVAMFDSPVWDEISKPCIGCGTCSFICPTCYCFDMGSEDHGTEGTKFRCWDSCMFSDYSRMAGGHNPRPSKKERVRNRYLHKLAYFSQRHGQELCVGCGRCTAKCPANMDITRFIKMISEVEANG